jgi:hypothetical protein
VEIPSYSKISLHFKFIACIFSEISAGTAYRWQMSKFPSEILVGFTAVKQ